MAMSEGCMAENLMLDHQRDAVSLAGQWERLLEHGEVEVWKANVAATLGPWTPVDVPGSNLMRPEAGQEPTAARELAKATKYVWIRRTFDVGEARASRDAVLKWGGIRFGASAWINGQLLGNHVPICPHTILLPRGTLKAGKNEIALRIPGWAGVPKSKSGYPLTPTGGATQSWGGKGPAVFQDIWLEFYDRVYLKRVLAMPDVAAKSVTFRIAMDSIAAMPKAVELVVEIREAGGKDVLATETIRVSPGGDKPPETRITCKLSNPKLWTPETPHLYEARLRAGIDGKPCDDVRFHFGMRQITIADGRFRLNSKPLWLRGSNLVNEWLWGDKFNDNVKQYIVDEARAMNLNVFRTHTQPPPTMWLDVADRHGMMIMAEMPLLYNHGDFKYTPDELEVLHKNAMLDAEGWITKLWNHPSVIMWVLVNESRRDRDWESGPYYRHAKAIDPTRPCMRTGDKVVGTPDMVDVHTCFNVVRDAEGQLHLDMAKLMAKKDPKRPLTNTEYMNHMWDPSNRWLGREKHPDMPLAYAGCAAEHTEAMRRLQFDCLLPYMYAGWTRLRGKNIWRDDYPTPMAAALHSTMAPVLASLDMFDRNHVAGATVDVPLVLINETRDKVPATLDLIITPRDPLFVPDTEALAAAVWHESRELTFEANSIRTITAGIPVPKTEGTYYLAAVIRRKGDTPVVSQRTLRAVNPHKHAASIKGRRVVVLGADTSIAAFLKRHQCTVVEGLTDGRVAGDVVLICDATKLTAAERQKVTGPLRAFAEAGGRIVVLDQTSWPWKELADCRIGLSEFKWRNPVICSRAHAEEGAEHAMLRDIPKDWLWRWNGLPGEIVNEVILDSPAMKEGRKILWASRPTYTAALSVPIGKGEILLSQLHIRRRLNPNGKAYDPVAERVLINLLRP
jgi:glycosyl hydrolase family 2